ncbi:hypothetical protein [Microbacterium sp. cx-59]|uniref:hypothetical protein n=1 Tax=Microbacterium sp. cx-59 TaxID=2891207 RepID=UPI001E62BCE9|nr:hypothetical protein [Microbacterium sp. cx-59]MCC4908719.1 hypothetical protein [Microbacterium sp. cx-59]
MENPRVCRGRVGDESVQHAAVRDLCEIVAEEISGVTTALTLEHVDLALADPALEQRVWVRVLDEGPATKTNLIKAFLHKIDYRR